VKQEVGPGAAAEVSHAVIDAVITSALAAHRETPGALLPILHAILDRLGYLPAPTVERVAAGLNLSRAEVHGVITFYPDFRTEPPGRHVLKLCRAEACQAMGADALAAHLQAHHRVALGETRPDGALTAEPVYCLGNCALSPAVLLDGKPHGRVSPTRLDRILAAALAADAAPDAAADAAPGDDGALS
jgi:formate dehydrogenase subunit gamma